MRRRKKGKRDRGHPFVEIEGKAFLNLAFDLEPRGEDVRRDVGELLGIVPEDLIVLRVLKRNEVRLLEQKRLDAEIEAWAFITA